MIINGKQMLEQVRDALRGHYPLPEAAAIAWRVAEAGTGLSRLDIMLGKSPVREPAWDLGEVIGRLRAYEPVQYVLGETEFAGLRLKVSPAVLIPRPETEELVEWIVQDCALAPQPPGALLDLGTGSGAIAVALAKKLAPVRALALDLSPAALAVARENATECGADVAFFQADMLDLRPGDWPALDLIVSNPPYVCQGEAAQMHPNVLHHEPQLALFVPDADPLRFYRALGQFARQKLKPGGRVYLEINEQLGAETAALLVSLGLRNPQLRRDLHGKERMLRAES
jgi:release factor glutamine methyltransferase